jgi:hypothetical protein
MHLILILEYSKFIFLEVACSIVCAQIQELSSLTSSMRAVQLLLRFKGRRRSQLTPIHLVVHRHTIFGNLPSEEESRERLRTLS